ncbi:MAG: MFS transporter [Xanthobacteraceae bacterium]
MYQGAPRIAIGLAGYCAFLNLYAPQAIMPLLAQEFGVDAAGISAVMTAGALSVALIAPFAGTVADVIGRKRVITAAMLVLVAPTIMIALTSTLPGMIVWRFLQGLVLPPIFAVAIAYVGEEWPPKEAAAVAGVYTSGASLGGFSGRFFTGILADLLGWRTAYLILAAITLALAGAVAVLLPREKRFVRSPGLLVSARYMLQHLRNPHLLATYVIGFGTLFNFIAMFTFVSFHLGAPPYNFSASLLGAVFAVYLAGTVLAPGAGWALMRFGRRPLLLMILAVWAVGAALTLAAPVWLIIVGLLLCAAAGLMCQAVSTGTVTITATRGASSAVGLYVTSFYIGGSVGAAIGGVAWTIGGWPACVAMVLAMLAAMAAIVLSAWR